jgi:hypothetical protein
MCTCAFEIIRRDFCVVIVTCVHTHAFATSLPQVRLRQLSLRAREAGLSSVMVFEGWDAAGKGGVIRRMARAMDVQDYRIVPIAAPSSEERRHHHLWRFWKELPVRDRMVIYDRSWCVRLTCVTPRRIRSCFQLIGVVRPSHMRNPQTNSLLLSIDRRGASVSHA